MAWYSLVTRMPCTKFPCGFRELWIFSSNLSLSLVTRTMVDLHSEHVHMSGSSSSHKNFLIRRKNQMRVMLIRAHMEPLVIQLGPIQYHLPVYSARYRPRSPLIRCSLAFVVECLERCDTCNMKMAQANAFFFEELYQEKTKEFSYIRSTLILLHEYYFLNILNHTFF